MNEEEKKAAKIAQEASRRERRQRRYEKMMANMEERRQNFLAHKKRSYKKQNRFGEYNTSNKWILENERCVNRQSLGNGETVIGCIIAGERHYFLKRKWPREFWWLTNDEKAIIGFRWLSDDGRCFCKGNRPRQSIWRCPHYHNCRESGFVYRKEYIEEFFEKTDIIRCELCGRISKANKARYFIISALSNSWGGKWRDIPLPNAKRICFSCEMLYDKIVKNFKECERLIIRIERGAKNEVTKEATKNRSFLASHCGSYSPAAQNNTRPTDDLAGNVRRFGSKKNNPA